MMHMNAAVQFPHLPFLCSFEESKRKKINESRGAIPNVSYIRIYEQESNRARARNNRKGRKRTRDKPAVVRKNLRLWFNDDLLLLCSENQTASGDSQGK